MSTVLLIEGDLDILRLKNALELLIQRHETLRTSFEWLDGEPVQRIHPVVSFEAEYITAAEEQIDALAKAFVRSFDLGQAPLLRVCLVRLAANRHVFLLDMHHIVSDGFSSNIFTQEIFELYNGMQLPALRIQYKDFVEWERKWNDSEAFHKQRAYWQEQLDQGYPVLRMPLDFKREKARSFNGNTLSLSFSQDVVSQLQTLALQLRVTMNTLLLSLYSILLSKYSGQNDIVVGSTVAGRKHSDLEKLIGVFINFLPIRMQINMDQTFTQYVEQASKRIVESYNNQDYPFDEMVAYRDKKHDPSRNPLYDTMLIFHNELIDSKETGSNGLKVTPYPLVNLTSILDFKLDLFLLQAGSEMLAQLQYNVHLFSEESMRQLLHYFQKLIHCIVAEPSLTLADIQLFTAEEEEILSAKRKLNDGEHTDDVSIVVSATFTAEPIEGYMKYWANQFSQPVQLHFAGYNQLFQELLDPHSRLSENTGANVLLIRFEDWLRDDSSTEEQQLNKLDKTYEQLVTALRDKEKSAPYFVGVFPVSTHLSLTEAVKNRISQLNMRWKMELAEMPSVYGIDFTPLGDLYGIRDVFDAVKDKMGHLPFSEAYYAAVGTTIARQWVAWKKQQFKVIVLDCDQTLWRGICGEEGTLGVSIDGPYAALQHFMLEQYNQGMLLALASKNNEEDVWEVFDKNPGMILKKDHFIACKINWQAKSANLREIAQELNLGLDSFIFVDDSPMECSEMMLQLPEVLTLHLPVDSSQIPSFLNHVWAFDRLKATMEDKRRTEMYISDRKRKVEQESQLSLSEFLSGLQLQLCMRPLMEDEIARASQLTQRTNQFNMSTIRRTENEIRQLIENANFRCRIVEVRDRFGDYGLVGLVIVKREETHLEIDTFLLSCRVLGRRVEDAILAGLKKLCREEGIDGLEASYYPTHKNKPFLEFIERSNWTIIQENSDSTRYALPLNLLADNVDHISIFFDTPFMDEVAVTRAEEPMSMRDTKTYVMDHVAIAVSDIDKEKVYYESLGFSSGEVAYDPLQHANVCMLKKSGYGMVELVVPVDAKSPVYSILGNNGGTPYHVCYRVNRFEDFLGHLSQQGVSYEVFSEAKPDVLAGHLPAMFIFIKNVGLIELLETDEMLSSDLKNQTTIRTTVQSLVAKPDEAVRFYQSIGYHLLKDSHNPIRNLRVLTLSSPDNGNIELLHPLRDTGEEAEFMQRSGTPLYRIVLQGCELGIHPDYLVSGEVIVSNEMQRSHDWRIELVNENQLLHRSHYAPLACVTPEKLLQLPVWETIRNSVVKSDYVAPRNELEAKIVSIWQEILKVDQIGMNDNFFELGGHSILAVRLEIELENHDLPVDGLNILEHRTVSEMAAFIESNLG